LRDGEWGREGRVMLWRVCALACLIAALGGCAGPGNPFAILPEPQDLHITPPLAGLASEVAAFWGIWEGIWRGRNGFLASRLIVEQVDSDSAQVVYIWGDDPQGHFKAGWGRFTARVVSGRILEFGWPQTKMVFEMAKDGRSLEGGRVQGKDLSAVIMRKVAP